MMQKQRLFILSGYIFLAVLAGDTFALNDSQTEMAKKFFQQSVEVIFKLAHPTGQYRSSAVRVLGDTVYIDIQYYSGWRNTNLSMELAINIGENVVLTDLQLKHDDALVPPFLATTMMKNMILDLLKDSENVQDQDKKGAIATLYESIRQKGEDVTGEQLCMFILNYHWINKGFSRNMQLSK